MEDQDPILAELTQWGRDHRHNRARDNLVHRAHTAGISKHQIHNRTGISRPTIDRILKENRVPVHKVTATTTETGPGWERSIAAWIEAAREAGHNATDTGETKPGNHRPVILVDGEHYVLSRTYDGAAGHTTVTAEKES